MGKLITVTGRTLLLSEKSHPSLNYQVVETDIPANKTRGNSQSILTQQIQLQCNCSGDYILPNSTFFGTGVAAIMASSKTVRCEQQQILLAGDQTNIVCNGTITNTNTDITAPGTASVTVTITNTNQNNIFAS